MSETDEEFMNSMSPSWPGTNDSVRLPMSDFNRLFDLARRGATANWKYAETCREAADRIEQLEAALRPLACTCKAKHQAECSRSEVDCPFWNARAALEDRT